VKRKNNVREQINRRIFIFSVNSNNRKRGIRPMDIVPICHEISSNKGKVFDEIREVFKFLNLQEGGILEDKAKYA
jgi:hypothetical protein